MKLPKLYSRDSKNRIRVWQIEADDSKYRTISSLLNGAEVCSEWTVCQGKNIGKTNETTPSQQAESEAKSKFKKKQESGYYEDINDVDKPAFYAPMLAHKFKEHEDKLPSNILVSPKMDGVRAIINKDGAFSRKGKEFPALSYIRQELDILFRNDPKLILDCEAYTHALKNDFDSLISLVKTTKNVDAAHIQRLKESNMQAWIFDMPNGCLLTEQDKFVDRYSALVDLFRPFNFRYSKILRYYSTTKDKIDESHEHYISEGFEGIMARDADTPYENKRSYRLQKLKNFHDDEYEIVDVLEGEGNRAGMMGKVLLKDKSGVKFKANSRGNETLYRMLLMNKRKYIGKLATVRYQNLTPPPESVPRFGVIVEYDRTT